MARILAMDIGHGTKDILLYDSRGRLENCIKMVLPSPAKLYAERVLSSSRDVELLGDTIGGGPLAYALRAHHGKGYRVRATRAASFAVRNNPAHVREAGVEVLEAADMPEQENGSLRLELDEMEIGRLRRFLRGCGESLDDLDAVAFAVQDHGAYAEGELNRVTRFRTFAEQLSADPAPWSLAFPGDEVPETFYRMRSGLARLRRELPGVPALAADTAMSALMGCRAEFPGRGIDLLVNMGNCHIMAAVFQGERILALMEHHTRMFRKRVGQLARTLRRFADGEISDEQMRDDGGEGALYFDPPGFVAIERILVTGPNRGLLGETDLDVLFPAPGGDMMMTGPVGLVKFVERRLGIV